MRLIKSFLLALLVLNTWVLEAQTSYIESLKAPNAWVTQTLKHMSKREKIAQLFFIRALSHQSEAYNDSIARFVKEEGVGGVIFFQGGPVAQAVLARRLQAQSKIPLLMAMDGEWGLGMRLDSTISYPYQMPLGAVQNVDLIKKMGVLVADDFKLMGMQLNFAPVVDVNNNAKNPVINYRSFGEDKLNVSQKGAAYLLGMQSQHILASLKHFPGHGDTEVDSHLGLPKIPFSKERLMNLEIFPFKKLIEQGASGVMVAHLNIPSLDASPNTPSTLSQPIVTQLLKQELGFKGLVITDAMEMKAVSKMYAPGIADLKAVQAGNDIIELSENTPLAIKTILKAARADKKLMAQIEESVRKILMAKYWSGLTKTKPIDINTLVARLNTPAKKQIQQQLAEASMTVIKGKAAINALKNERRTALIAISPDGKETTFQKGLKLVYNAQVINVKSMDNLLTLNALSPSLNNYQQIIVAISDDRSRPAINLPLSDAVKDFIGKMSQKGAHIVFFANPYCLAEINNIEKSSSILVAYQKEEMMQQAAIKVFTKKINPNGKLPVTVNSVFKYGMGE